MNLLRTFISDKLRAFVSKASLHPDKSSVLAYRSEENLSSNISTQKSRAAPLLSAKRITKTFLTPSPIPLLKGIDLTLFPGESIAIVGKSGEGKSTLLHILGTLDHPTSGEVHIAQTGQTLSLSQIRNQKLGFIFQHAHLIEEETLLGNILMPARIARKATHSGSSLFERALFLIQKVGLIERLHSPCKLLSGGEKQRAAIARALLLRPSILLADEPSGSLDSNHSHLIQDLLLSAVSQEDTALIIATHDMDFAKKCTHLLHLKDGLLSTLAATLEPR